jgi:hypothetical protein
MAMKPFDKNEIIIAKKEDIDKMDSEYWSNAPIKERLQTVTFLRECFYGKKATTGRIQRIYTMFKQE